MSQDTIRLPAIPSLSDYKYKHYMILQDKTNESVSALL